MMMKNISKIPCRRQENYYGVATKEIIFFHVAEKFSCLWIRMNVVCLLPTNYIFSFASWEGLHTVQYVNAQWLNLRELWNEKKWQSHSKRRNEKVYELLAVY